MKMNGVIQDCECSAELKIAFDNFSGQNKNNTVLKLVPYLLKWVISRK